jgi:hypothetical protein
MRLEGWLHTRLRPILRNGAARLLTMRAECYSISAALRMLAIIDDLSM